MVHIVGMLSLVRYSYTIRYR